MCLHSFTFISCFNLLFGLNSTLKFIQLFFHLKDTTLLPILGIGFTLQLRSRHLSPLKGKVNVFIDNIWDYVEIPTLTLGSRPMQGLVRVQAKKEAWESYLMLLRV
jgi:hypothetical protein